MVGGRRATVRDVAAVAGVSIGTVSRYLNGRPLMPRTRELVEKGMRETSYRETAAALRQRRTMTGVVGAVFPNFDTFHAEMLDAIEKVLSRHSYHVITSGYEDDAARMREKLGFLRGRDLDGIICSSVKSTLGSMREASAGALPFVTYNNKVDAWQTDHVCIDDRLAAARAVEHLIHMNHRRIAIVSGDRETSTGWNRLEGYYDALHSAGIRERSEYVRGGEWGHLGSVHWARELLTLPDPPTAIFVSNYLLANGVLKYCRESGIGIPEDVSVVTFDDTMTFKLHQPPITVVRQPVDQIAEEVATLLFRRIAGDWDNFPVTRTLRAEMVLRESVRKLS